MRRKMVKDVSVLGIDEVIAREIQYHTDFFGEEFDLTQFQETLQKYGEVRVKEWQKWLEPHFLPDKPMAEDVDYPGLKVKPEPWYYRMVDEGKILRQQTDGTFVPDREAFKLRGITVLVDTRCKPAYDGGEQMWEGDEHFLGPIIEELRTQGRIARYEFGPQSSRFGISADEAEQELWPALAERLLGLKAPQVRSERAIEFNVLSQMIEGTPRENDGKTDTWLWFADIFEDRGHRLYGGFSGCGGLADVGCHWSRYHWYDGSVRPLAVL